MIIRMKNMGKKEKAMLPKKVLMVASVASMIDQFNLPNIRLMQQMGYEVHVACNFKEGNTCSEKRLRELQQILDGMHVAWHQWDCPRSIYAFHSCLKAYRQVWELTGTYGFAWMHCHSPIGGVLARIAAHRRGIPVIYTAHGFHFYKGAPIKNWLLSYSVEKLLAYWTDVLITINKEDYWFAKRNLKAGKIYRIPGVGIDVCKYAGQRQQMGSGKGCVFSSHRLEVPNKFLDGEVLSKVSGRKEESFLQKFRIPKGAFVLLSVGELNKGKNHRVVIAALAALKRQDIYYLICGQGILHGQLQQYAERLGVGCYLRMPGYQENMDWIYRNGDIFVFPSVREGMPVALMEAMAAGLPCVVSDIRGNRELIDGSYKENGIDSVRGGGMRVPPEDARQFRNALKIFLDDAQLRQKCGDYNREKIKKFDQTVVQERMKKVYGSMERQ